MFSIDLSLTYKVIIGFICCTIIGTLSHEYGHILVAEYLDYNTELHYASMDYSGGVKDELLTLKNTPSLNSIYVADQGSILMESFRQDSLWIAMGGPIQTLLTSLLGLGYLIYRRSNKWEWDSWGALFAAFFSTRFIFNFLHACLDAVLNGKLQFTGDEGKIAWLIKWPEYSLSVTMFFVGAAICAYCTLILLPRDKLVPFVVGGLTGGGLGFYLWMEEIGPMILP